MNLNLKSEELSQNYSEKMVILVDVIREGFCEQVEHSHSRGNT